MFLDALVEDSDCGWQSRDKGYDCSHTKCMPLSSRGGHIKCGIIQVRF